MNEVDRAFSFISAQLAADAALTPLLPGGAWQGAAPPGTGALGAYAVYDWQGGHDVLVSGGRRVMNDSLYRVLVWGQTDPAGGTGGYAAVAAAEDELDAALTRKSGAAGADGKVLSCVREQPLSLSQLEEGILWSGLGGIYRIYVQPASGLAQ